MHKHLDWRFKKVKTFLPQISIFSNHFPTNNYIHLFFSEKHVRVPLVSPYKSVTMPMVICFKAKGHRFNEISWINFFINKYIYIYTYIYINKPWRETLKSTFYSQFQRLLMTWLNAKCCKSVALNVSKFGKLSSGHRTGKVSFHSNPKERQCQRMIKTTSQLHSSHMLVN